jgi:hypothetical protein
MCITQVLRMTAASAETTEKRTSLLDPEAIHGAFRASESRLELAH